MSCRVTMFVLNDMRLDSRVHREARALAAVGFDVHVFAVMSDATAHRAEEEVDGFAIHRVPMLMSPLAETPGVIGTPRIRMGLRRRAITSAFVSTRPFLGGSLHLAANWQFRWRSWARRVLVRCDESQVWHAHDFNTLGIAISAATRHGGSVIYDSHELFMEAGAMSRLPAVVRSALRHRERVWATRAAAVVTVNESVAAVLRAQLGRDVSVVHNCAEPPQSGHSPLRDSIGVGTDAEIVLYHGSVTSGRGLERLIQSFELPRLAGARLAIMGYGPLRPRLERLAGASAAAERIHFLPPVPPADVTTWVAGADVAVMPIEPTTLNHRLSSPNKLFEAIAAGVPVVGPDFVEFRRVVYDGPEGPLGRLHADHAPATIAGAIADLLSMDIGAKEALRNRCRRAAQRLNWAAEAGRLLEAYNTVVAAPYAGSPLPPLPFPRMKSAADLEVMAE